MPPYSSTTTARCSLRALHLGQHKRQAQRLGHKAGGRQDVAQLKIPAVEHLFVKMVELQHPDDVVDAALIDRNAREGGVVDNALHLVERLLDVDGQHVDTVGRNLLRLNLGKFNGRLQQGRCAPRR